MNICVCLVIKIGKRGGELFFSNIDVSGEYVDGKRVIWCRVFKEIREIKRIKLRFYELSNFL